MDAAVASRLGSVERPPPWIDVTTALRFMVDDSRIVMHPVRLTVFFFRMKSCFRLYGSYCYRATVHPNFLIHLLAALPAAGRLLSGCWAACCVGC